MDNALEYIKKLKDILQEQNMNENIYEIAARFGAIKNELNDDELSEQLNDIENILKKSLSKGDFENDDKFDLFSKLGSIEAHVKGISSDKTKKTINGIATGVGGAIAARALISAGPLGMLAAGVLGVAGSYILSSNEEPRITNKDLLTIAYYLSRFDHNKLFDIDDISSAKAMTALGNVLNVKPNTIRGKRDYFDALLPPEDKKSSRKGYSDIKATSSYQDIIDKYSSMTNDDEKKMRNIVHDILDKYKSNLILN